MKYWLLCALSGLVLGCAYASTEHNRVFVLGQAHAQAGQCEVQDLEIRTPLTGHDEASSQRLVVTESWDCASVQGGQGSTGFWAGWQAIIGLIALGL